jgi:gliding motility-associated lipoprotein GldH
MSRSLIAIVVVLCLITGCLPSPYFQKQEPVPQDAWSYNFKPVFTFDITDTNATYQPSFIIRHTQAYPYSNLWLWLYIKVPGDSVIKKERVNVPLAESNGKWLGRGMGEIYEQRVRIQIDSVKFNKAGTYHITIEQNMRINPLPEVLNVGIRMEKGER